jgi:hypothetical protein
MFSQLNLISEPLGVCEIMQTKEIFSSMTERDTNKFLSTSPQQIPTYRKIKVMVDNKHEMKLCVDHWIEVGIYPVIF